MTIQECAKQSRYSKMWLCPNLVTSGKLSIDPLLSGFECSPNTVPESLKDKEVVKHFAEDSITCVIWEYIPYRDGEYRESEVVQ